MSWWGRPAQAALLILVLLGACKDDTSFLGFPKPDRSFKVSVAEFTIPTTVLVIDSINTTNSAESATIRLLAGRAQDNTFGITTANAFAQYLPVAYPIISETATLNKVVLTMVCDYYHFGSEVASLQTFQIVELRDSLINSLPYYSNTMVEVEPGSIGTALKIVNPTSFDQDLEDNLTATTLKSDSIEVELSTAFGERLFAAARDTTLATRTWFQNYSRFRRVFKGIGIIPESSNDQIIGFDPVNVKSRLTMYYTQDGVTKSMTFTFTPSSGATSFSQINADRSGTALSGLQSKYQEIIPSDGNSYLQSGTGLVTKFDFSQVYEYFKDIEPVALNAAELSFSANQRPYMTLDAFMRGVKPNNRYKLGAKIGQNVFGDTLTFIDVAFFSRHLGGIIPNTISGVVDIQSDDGASIFTVQATQTGGLLYKGFLTSFFQTELNIRDNNYLNQFILLPLTPDLGKAVNGLSFSKDVNLKIYYTTPFTGEQ